MKGFTSIEFLILLAICVIVFIVIVGSTRRPGDLETDSALSVQVVCIDGYEMLYYNGFREGSIIYRLNEDGKLIKCKGSK